MKTIPRVKTEGARRLSPMEMNDLHFKTADSHTPLQAKPSDLPTSGGK